MPEVIPWPPHAYVPGQNARHPEDWFEAVRTTATQDGCAERSFAWRVGLAYLEEGYFWECHEVLEAVWMVLPDPSPERDIAQAVIQLANARLKFRMGKMRAVQRLCGMVDELISEHRGVILGLDVQQIAKWSSETRATVT